MLVIRCAACKTKLLRYRKRGKGEVLRCHRARVDRVLAAVEEDGWLCCPCGNRVGIDKGTYFKMVRKAFVYSGATVTRL